MQTPRVVTAEQIKDWTENPTTRTLRWLIQEEIKAILETSIVDCFFPNDPQKTQENLIELEARLTTWRLMDEFLDGDWSYLEVEEIEDE